MLVLPRVVRALALALFAATLAASGQDKLHMEPISLLDSSALASLNTQVLLAQLEQTQSPDPAQGSTPPSQPAAKPSDQAPPQASTLDPNAQPKRILGVMPNFRAVSAGSVPPPPTSKQAFIIATQNTFDYSSFIFVGITSLLSQAADDHRQLGEGIGGYGRYYWRGFVDKADGNYWVIFILPTIFHQDERYFALGKGGIVKRLFYAASRVFVTPNYQGRLTFNTSELLGRGIAQGASLAYYPSQTRTPESIASKYAYAIGRDALTNAFREVWPDIATHVLHRHP